MKLNQSDTVQKREPQKKDVKQIILIIHNIKLKIKKFGENTSLNSFITEYQNVFILSYRHVS